MASAMGFYIMVLSAAGIIIVNLLLHNSNHHFHYFVTFFLYKVTSVKNEKRVFAVQRITFNI